MQRIALSRPQSNGYPSGCEEEGPSWAIVCLAFPRKENLQHAARWKFLRFSDSGDVPLFLI